MSDFKTVQQQFMAHIRHGDATQVIDGIEDRRMAIYRELFFNNIDGFVSSSFPVLKSLFAQDKWQQLIRDFFILHQCHSPYFVDISQSFVEYLTCERSPQTDDLPFMLQLAHYEWVELEVSVRHEQQHYTWLPSEIAYEQALVLSELAWPLSYEYAVHQISVDYQPDETVAGGVHLVVYRDEEDDVQFMQINAITGILLQLLADNPSISLGLLVETLVESLPQFAPEQIQSGAIDMVNTLAERGIIRAHKS